MDVLYEFRLVPAHFHNDFKNWVITIKKRKLWIQKLLRTCFGGFCLRG